MLGSAWPRRFHRGVASLRFCFLRSVARDYDLIRVLMGVRGVDLEPARDVVAAVLGVRALALPLGLGQAVEQISAVERRAALNASSDASSGRS